MKQILSITHKKAPNLKSRGFCGPDDKFEPYTDVFKFDYTSITKGFGFEVLI
jgi:hypothetical protein